METKSLKALANAVLERNKKGNSKETFSFPDGNLGGTKNLESFPEKTAGKPAEPITQEVFRKTLNHLTVHLRQRDYSPENMGKLQAETLEMDQAWEALDYPEFKKAVDAMMKIPDKAHEERTEVHLVFWRQKDSTCYACHSRGAWLSIHNVLVCGKCHPPATDSLVKEYMRGTA